VTDFNVSHRRSRATENSYRDAVKEIIDHIGAGLTDQELADRIGCSAGTISHARNKKGNLSPVTLAHIGDEFGPEALQPYADLFNGEIVAADGDDSALDDVIEHATGAVAKLFHIRRGGVNHTHERPIRDTLKNLRSKITGYLEGRRERRAERKAARMTRRHAA
jgi:transcriptional regulator with XRE-family HTH domain